MTVPILLNIFLEYHVVLFIFWRHLNLVLHWLFVFFIRMDAVFQLGWVRFFGIFLFQLHSYLDFIVKFLINYSNSIWNEIFSPGTTEFSFRTGKELSLPWLSTIFMISGGKKTIKFTVIWLLRRFVADRLINTSDSRSKFIGSWRITDGHLRQQLRVNKHYFFIDSCHFLIILLYSFLLIRFYCGYWIFE